MPKKLTKVKKKPAFKPIKVMLTFKEDDIDAILRYATLGDDEDAPRARRLTPAQYRDLAKELRDSAVNFVLELVEGSEQACANDWLFDFMEEHFPRDEDEDEE